MSKGAVRVEVVMIIKGILHQSCEFSLHLGILLHAFMSSADFFISFNFFGKKILQKYHQCQAVCKG